MGAGVGKLKAKRPKQDKGERIQVKGKKILNLKLK
jgi:hypothetical protein